MNFRLSPTSRRAARRMPAARRRPWLPSGGRAGACALGIWLGAAVSSPALPMLQIIHGWPDAPEAQDALRQRLRERGFGGVVCNVSFDRYLESDEKWAAFTRAVKEAKRDGMTLWLYDERGYPSGNAGGIVLRDHADWEASGLMVARAEAGAGKVELDVPPGRVFLAAAYPARDGALDPAQAVDLTAAIRDGRLTWEAPVGRWTVLAIAEGHLYEGTHAEGNLAKKMPYVDLLRPEPTAYFLEVTHRRYAQRLSANLGEYFEAAFMDEPSLMSLYLRPMPWRPLPWAPNLPVEFGRRRGYALDGRVVLSLLAETGPPTAKHRYDFWRTVGELVSENFFGQIQTECRRLQFPSGGHLLMEEGLVSQVPLYGDFFACARRLDAPSIDCLTSIPAETPWQIARQMASVAELEERRLTMCETSDHSQVYRPAGDNRPKRIVTEAEMRGTLNRLILGGINRITSYYRYTEIPAEVLRRVNGWVDRCTGWLEGGHQVADVALVFPVESLWTKFTPARHWANESPAATRVESLYHAAAENLFAAQRDFTVVDSKALSEAQPNGEALQHRKLAWRVVVLPGVDTLPLAAWENLVRFVRQGGVVVALGALPVNSDTEFPSALVGDWAREVFGPPGSGPRIQASAGGGAGIFLPRGSESLLATVLRGVVGPDVGVAAERAPVRVTHRRIDGREVFFVINDRAEPWQGDLTFAAGGAGERLDPASGERVPVAEGAVATRLEGYGAAVFTFPEARPPQRLRLGSGSLPNLALSDLPPCQPTIGAGEFVRSRCEPDPQHAAENRPAWRAAGTLTRSKVDTFLFTMFRPERPLDLADADCLALDTWTPEGQRTPAELLVILREENGGDFIAHTGRSLAVAGSEASFVAWSQFQLAGWSQDADGVLDLRRIAEIRVGWGGYLGTEGESVVFSLAAPRLGRIETKARP